MERLSESNKLPHTETDVGLIMVGSFAPFHEGHADAMDSAKKVLSRLGENVVASVFVPNSDTYVSKKLCDTNSEWNFQRRVQEFDKKYIHETNVYVDDITGYLPQQEVSISELAIDTVHRKLGIAACRLSLVVGGDQLESIRPHLQHNRAICVLRPGWEEEERKVLMAGWTQQAIESGQCIITHRQRQDSDISSTVIRAVNDL